jgi:hypothetical protein
MRNGQMALLASAICPDSHDRRTVCALSLLPYVMRSNSNVRNDSGRT